MNTPNNKRGRETEERMERVFVELLQSRNLDQISISELCQKAKVNRTTFYAHYDGLYSIADAIRLKLEANMKEMYHDAIGLRVNSHDYLKLFRHIKENQVLYRTYFKLGYDNQYKIITYDKDLSAKHFGNKLLSYHMEFFRAGITRIIKMWLDGGCRESAEEMFDVIKSEYQGREQ
ncbi:MAG: TetR/AcrR family transcriptional regulator C-terminal domain-containing protein [Sphaerochaetaceae bacterium]|nr:TetR/AcrR family transcriptional regulator C-terminal domain-containing protein [Spirochaetales bacterium]MDY5499085.1 TetR/AcrR family transcriptional regulator C-terminal domain-containing protein [Sphaerochaetaceae bacterium]